MSITKVDTKLKTSKKSSTHDLLSKLGQAMTPSDSKNQDFSIPAAGSLIKTPNSRTAVRAGKITATIYPADWHRLDEIKDFFRSRGFRNLSDSEALRLACRGVHIDDQLISFYEDMKQEDGRQRRSA